MLSERLQKEAAAKLLAEKEAYAVEQLKRLYDDLARGKAYIAEIEKKISLMDVETCWENKSGQY